MPHPTDVLRVVHSLAAVEAESLGASELSVEFLFVALGKADLLQDDAALQAAGLPAELREATREGASPVLAAFGEAGFDAVRARRRVRELWLREHPERAAFGGHRTPACRAAFAAAERRARGSRLLVALLHAVLDAPGPLLARVLAEQEESAMRLKRAVEARLPEAPERGIARWGRDLTRLAREGKLRPALARDEETKQVARILMQAGKSNPLLVGDAGVGKTAIVEGLAVRLAGEGAPPALRDHHLVEVTPGALLAGTSHRGELEERVLEILEAAKGEASLVLFLDEAHALLGGAPGAQGVADLLKPALARGELSCIAATTPAEYRRHVEGDSALARRFQVVWVEEPTPEQARAILEGVRPGLESHHGLRILDAALDAAVDLSVRHLPEQRLPDKAIDLLDQACTRALLDTFSRGAAPGRRPPLGRGDIARAVSERCRVPVDEAAGDEAERMLAMEDALRRRVIGQDGAIAEVAATLRAAAAGVRDARRPRGVFLLLGPTGTGKTELARAVAEFLSGDERSLVRIDLSEFGQKHQVARLIGAPPGYVGHDQGGQLTDAVRARPSSVVLFDEVEKAHPDVHALFLQIFDEGALTDGRGRTTSFRETVVFLTSNLGAGEAPARVGFQAGAPAGPASSDERMREAVRAAFPPELRNRIQKTLVFSPLGPEAVRGIVDKVVLRVNGSLAGKGIALELTDEARDLLAARGFSPEYGARSLERVFSALVEEPLGRRILDGRVRPGQRVRLGVADGEISFEARP